MRPGVLLVLALAACGRFRFDPVGGAATSDAFPDRDGPSNVSCIKQLDVGSGFACILATDGRVWCWGLDGNNELGDGLTVNRAYPARATGYPPNVDRLALGGFHGCAVTTDQQLYCLGANYFAQLGMGATGSAMGTAVPISLPGPVAAAAGGEESQCALLTDGTVYCWGRNYDGEVGDGSPMNIRPSPSQAAISGVVEIVHNNHHVCARDDAQIYCWGDNTYGQLGDGTRIDRHLPTPTGLVGTQLAVADHSCAQQSDATITCWGNNYWGQIGDNTMMDRPAPTTPLGLPPVTRFALGYHHSCVIDTNADLWCWGQNSAGQVGNGALNDQWTPVRVLDNVLYAAGGWDFTCAVQSTGYVKCWGDNKFGQLGANSTIGNSSTPIDTVFSCDLP